jgi:hypothetical protein
MKSNLAILIKIRKSEFEMEKLAKQLQRCHEEMIKRGMEIPIACTLQASNYQGETTSSTKNEEKDFSKDNKKDTQKNRLNAETTQGSHKKAKAQEVSTGEDSLDDSSSDTSSDEEI